MDQISTIEDLAFHDQCIGCGACTVGTCSSSQLALNSKGLYGFPLENASSFDDNVCPFLSDKDEDSIASQLFDNLPYQDGIGFYDKIWAGFVNEGNFRKAGTSGGLGTWIPAEMLKNKLVDGILHVKPTGFDDHPYYEYAISYTQDSVLQGSQSRYYPVKFDNVISEVIASGRSYCFIGLPCHVKAIRLLQNKYPALKARIPYTVSIVCGHMKSAFWTDMLAWSAGIHSGNLSYFQHRTKLDTPNFQIRKYISTAISKIGDVKVFDTAPIPGGKFNSCAFMANACNFCDDIVGETSDIVLGDAWLPRFETDKLGTNLIIARNPELSSMLENAHLEGLITLYPVSSVDAAWAQAGGIRQRREGLSYRLYRRQALHLPNPRKRVLPSGRLSLTRKIIYLLRVTVQRQSFVSFDRARRANNLSQYFISMYPVIFLLRSIEVFSSLHRITTRRLGWLIYRSRRPPL